MSVSTERQTTVVTAIPVTDLAVLAIAVRLHDQKCHLKATCHNRDWHAMSNFEAPVRNFLTVAAEAVKAGEI
ncbi:MAG TPA: hypothetical protein VF867_13220 [Arthrobacter sp.]